MNITKFLIFIFLFNGFFMQSQTLKEYRWKNRVIILVDSQGNTKAFQKQQNALSVKTIELRERDLIILLLKEDSVEFSNNNKSQIEGSSLRKELNIDTDFEGVILIGKDGGIKMRENFHVDPQKIFDLIDSMLMRQAEMKN